MGKPTLTYIELQICEKFGINPLKYFAGEKSDWRDSSGEAIRALLIAYHQINAEEESRINKQMQKKQK